MKWLVAILLITNLITGALLIKNRTNNQNIYTVSRVIDGDTLVTDNSQEIRLATVDAPEINNCGGKEAKAELEKLTLGKKIKIEGTVNDKFGRLLASVWVGEILVNQEMARLGWARYTSQDSNQRELIKTADDEAKVKKLGIYNLCLEETNRVNPKCQIKGNNREGKKIYVMPGCKGYTNTDIEKDLGDEWFCSEKEAAGAGYTKAQNCQ